MLEWKTVAAAALLAFAAQGAAAQAVRQAPTPADLQGAWRLVERATAGKKDKADGYLFFAGNRMGFITTGERRDMAPEINQKPIAELNDEEKRLTIEAYRGMTSAAGTYVIEEGEIRFTVQVSRQTRLPTKSENRRSWIEGDRLVQDFVNSRGVHSLLVWERAK